MLKMPTITLKQVRFSELDQLQNLGKTTFLQAFGKENDPKDMSLYLDEYFSLSHLQKEWKNPESQFWFAIYKNEAIGYLKVNWGKAQTEHQVKNALEIQRIYVLENFHGKKVGQQLLNKAFEITRKNQLKTIWLGVWAKNAIALRFYEKNGFKVFDEHQFLFGNDLQTDLMMKLELAHYMKDK